jgi:hypothetical protein
MIMGFFLYLESFYSNLVKTLMKQLCVKLFISLPLSMLNVFINVLKLGVSP